MHGLSRARWGRTSALLVVSAMVLAGCGSDQPSANDGAATEEPAEDGEQASGDGEAASDDGEAGSEDGGSGEVPVIPILADPSGTAIAVAAGEDLFDGCAVEIEQVGYGESSTLFLAGDTPVTLIAPHEIAMEQAAGEDIVFFSTAAALNFVNGIVVRAEDADQYQEIPDLSGATLGIPGFGTGTWSAFMGLTQSLYGIDPTEEFEIIEASPGALLGLLEQGEIDAALTFAAQAGAAMGLEQFELITSFSQSWEQEHGQPLTITGLGGRTEWLENNTDAARCLVRGIDEGVQWMKDNPDEFREDGKYAEWVGGEGWHYNEEVTQAIIETMQDGDWYFTHAETYNQEWIDASYEFAKATFTGDGEMPPKEELFYPAGWLDG